MVIRCVCGNETTVSPGAKPGYYLRDEKWFDRDKSELRCPKCKSTSLPLELIDAGRAGDPIKVQVVPGRTIPKKFAWT